MESFKAANPGCVLADFVRWHSPRDWDQDKCKLSPRMEIEGNIWKEAWENSKPVPAKRQRRLFDEDIILPPKKGEKKQFWLSKYCVHFV